MYLLNGCVILFVCVPAVFAVDIDNVLQRLEALENKELESASTISELKKHLLVQDDLKQQLFTLEQRITQLEVDAEHKDDTITKQNKRIEDLVNEIESLKELTHPSTQDQYVDPDTDDNTILDFAKVKHKKRSDDRSPKYINPGNQTNSTSKTIGLVYNHRRFVVDPEAPVAFHAVLDGGENAHIGTNQHIVFDTELLNVGGGYHKQQGLFIAPTKGIYVFSSSIMSFVDPHPEFTADLVKNGNLLSRIYGHGDNGRHDQGSVTVTTQLEAGDEVWVKMETPDDSLWGARYTSFTGFLLFSL